MDTVTQPKPAKSAHAVLGLFDTLSLANQSIARALMDTGVARTQIDSLITTFRTKSGLQTLSHLIVEFGLASEKQVAEWVAHAHGLGVATITDLQNPQKTALRFLPQTIAKTRCALPLRIEQHNGVNTAIIAISDPEGTGLSQVRHSLGSNAFVYVIAPRSDINVSVDTAYATAISISRNSGGDEDNGWASFIEDVFKKTATTPGASDLHIIPEEKVYVIKVRIDGIMTTKHTVEGRDRDHLVGAVKLSAGRMADGKTRRMGNLGGLDITQKLKPQDASAERHYGSLHMSLRYSLIPTDYGESIVIRFLNQDAQIGDLASLGMLTDHAASYRQAVCLSSGIICNCGPTGHGKSTTLAAAVQYINVHSKRVVTVEDPIEYRFRHVTQFAVQSELLEMTFAAILRALVRHNPNVILLGEMRDEESVKTGLQMSNTGHLLNTTTHANTALGGFSRLLDLGAEAAMLANAARLFLGQRLVRRLCPECRQPHPQDKKLKEEHTSLLIGALKSGLIKKEQIKFWEPGPGCPHCGGGDANNSSGFKGRVGMFEMRVIRPSTKSLLTTKKKSFSVDEAEMEYTHAYKKGDMLSRSLLQDGIIKAAIGVTDIEEVVSAAAIEI